MPLLRGRAVLPAMLGVLLTVSLTASMVATAQEAFASGVQPVSARPAPVRRHEPWNDLLTRYVARGRVDYRGLARDRAKLEHYLRGLATTDADRFRHWHRADRIAFWINAYNAYTVSLILDHYPLASIWNVTPLWKRPLGGPFKLRFIPLGYLAPEVGTGSLSLDDIEHKILRGSFGERRVHFAVVCASKGCPSLLNEAFEGPRLAEQLDRAARGFLADSDKNRYEPATNTLYLSPIFKWFPEDFEPIGGAVGFFRQYGPPGARTALAAKTTPPKVEYTDYDWSLNEAGPQDETPNRRPQPKAGGSG